MRQPQFRKKKVSKHTYGYTEANGDVYFGKVGEAASEDAKHHFGEHINQKQPHRKPGYSSPAELSPVYLFATEKRVPGLCAFGCGLPELELLVHATIPPQDLSEQSVLRAGEVCEVVAAPGTLEVMAGPEQHAEKVVLADIQTGVDERLVPLLQQAIELKVIDSDGAVCFALQGNDLLNVER